jgi:hypothetical protein
MTECSEEGRYPSEHDAGRILLVDRDVESYPTRFFLAYLGLKPQPPRLDLLNLLVRPLHRPLSFLTGQAPVTTNKRSLSSHPAMEPATLRHDLAFLCGFQI